jgi:6-methylsalicylate decarboxylase
MGKERRDSVAAQSAVSRIDTHHHVVPAEYRAWLDELGVQSGGTSVPEWSPEHSLEMMDRLGIETAILSLSAPGLDPAEYDEIADRARAINEFCASVHAEHPGRFGWLATVALPDVDGSVHEVEYALDVLGADGVALPANARGIYLGTPEFDPVMEALNQREAVIFIHPGEPPMAPVRDIPPAAIDFLLDTTRAALSLARTGCMERYSRTKMILAHGGGFLPFAAQRMARNASPSRADDDGLKALKEFFFDTALTSSPFALPSIFAFADRHKVTFGTDFPFAPAERAQRFTEGLDAYDAADHAAVNRGNAELLFPRFAHREADPDIDRAKPAQLL